MVMEKLVPDICSEAWQARPCHLTRGRNCINVDVISEKEGPICISHGLCGEGGSNKT